MKITIFIISTIGVSRAYCKTSILILRDDIKNDRILVDAVIESL